MSKTTSSAADRAGPGRGRQPDHAVGKAPAGNSSWHRLATFTPRNAAEIDRQLGPGQALDAGLKGRMEGVLASPLGEVRIHKDTEGQGLTGSVGAEAFALGHHVAFSADAYRPGTPLGDALIAHELAHVAQQRGAMGPEGSTAEAAAEADADRSMWGLFSGRGTAPRHRSGLSLRRCSGSPTTLPVAQAKFHSNNTGMLGGLTDAEATKVEAAVGLAAKTNEELAIGFYNYYSSHEINKVDATTAAKWKTAGQYASTSPNSDTEIRPDLVDASTSNERLAGILLHEFTHTRHQSSPMGSRDYQEGEAYGTELFFARRHGDAARVKEIEGIRLSPGKVVTGASQQKLFLDLFAGTYSGLAGLYEVIDTGASKHKGSPFDGMAQDKARELSAELIGKEAASRSASLTSVLTWVKGNPTAYPP